jgi:hypothetical protein
VIVYDETVREALATLADNEYQSRVWTGRGSKPDEMDSFEECCERLYTDSGLSDALERRNRVFTPEIDQSLVALDQLLGKIDTRQTPDALVEDPIMNDVRQLARDILRDLDSLSTS